MLAEARHQMMALERLEKERHARELENHSDQAPETSETSLVRSEAVKKQRLRAPSVWDLWRCLNCFKVLPFCLVQSEGFNSTVSFTHIT